MQSLDRRDTVALAALVAVGVGVPLSLAWWAGAIGVPSNDDWVYMRAAEAFRSGSDSVPGHTAAAIGVVLLVQPLLALSGGATWAFTVFGLLMAAVGVAATYLLARRFLGTGHAVFVVLIVLAIPGFERLAGSFLTDVPAYGLITLCLYLGVRWVQGDRGRATLVAALAVGLVGFSIREFALAAPVAILLVAWTHAPADQRRGLALLTTLFVAGAIAISILAAVEPGRGIPVEPAAWLLILLGPAFVTLAALLLPATILAAGRLMAVLEASHVVIAAAIVGIGILVPYGALVGHLWMTYGITGNALLSGVRERVIDEPAWGFSERLALFAAILLATLGLWWIGRLIARARRPSGAARVALEIARREDGLLIVFLAGYAAELVAFSAVSTIFDRYLFPLVPGAAILLLRVPARTPSPGRSRPLAHAAWIWLAASAFALATNSFAYDAARYRAGEAAVALGYPAESVDAGYEWVGWHAPVQPSPRVRTYGLTWYDDAFLTSAPCAVVSNSPLEGPRWRLIRLDGSAYLQYLFVGPEQPLYLYGSTAAACPVPPASTSLVSPQP